ncbi:MAG TPA: sigma-70 family RNA polymerase sigma factor [Gemmatimonadaceae bacterium]|jgi:RNA polymerase sigma factor, sigma-70 family
MRVMREADETFLELVRANEARLRKICRVYASDADAEKDLYQDILVQLWRALPSFEGSSQPGTWLYRVALNTALAQKRQRAARESATIDESNAIWRNPIPAPDESLESKQRLERLYAAIARLDDVDKAVVMMYLDEKSHREIAEVLGITESYVGVKLHRIRKEMAAWLAGEAA